MKGTASCGYLETNTGMYQLYRYATTTEQGNQQVNWCCIKVNTKFKQKWINLHRQRVENSLSIYK